MTVVATESNIVINFPEAVDYGSGNIVIYKASDDSEVETINITSPNVLNSGAILTTPDVFDEADEVLSLIHI